MATYVGWDLVLPNGHGMSVQVLSSQGRKSLDLIATWDDNECPAATSRILRGRSTYLVRIPSRCLRRAEGVQVSAGMTVDNERQRKAWYDVAGLGSDLEIKWSVTEEHHGRRIFRG